MFVIYLAAQGRGEHKQMADDVHHGADVDRVELEGLNRQIQDNPNMMLPAGYRRAIENQVHHEHKMPIGLISMGVKPSWMVAYEVLDEILNEQFGFHVMESKAVFNTHVKVVPHQVHEVGGVNRGRARLEKEDLSESRGKSNDFDKKKKKFASDNRSNREVSVDRFEGFGSKVKKIVNKVMEDKMKKQDDEKRKQDEIDKKRRQRTLEVQARMREISEQKREKEAKAREEKKQEEDDKDEIERLKDEKKRKELERKKQMVDNYRERKEQENIRKEEREKEEAIKKVEARKQQAISLKKQTEHMKHLLEDKKNQRIEQENVRNYKEEEEKKKADQKKKKVGVTLEKEKEKREREKQINNEIIQLHESPTIQSFYSAHAKTLGAVFKHYKESATRDILTFKELMTLGAQLNIFPSLVSLEELKLIFRSLTRDKKEIGLTYNDFLQALLRISVKSQPVLNRIAEQTRGRGNVGSNMLNELMDTAKREFGHLILTKDQAKEMQMSENYEKNNVNNQVEDTYQSIGGTNKETMEGLYIYLDLPSDPKALQEKLKSLRIENQKIVAPRDKKRVVQSIGGGNQRSANSRSPAPVKKNAAPVKLAPISKAAQIKGLPQKNNNMNSQSNMNTISSPASKRVYQGDPSQESLSQSPMRDQSPMRSQSPMKNGSLSPNKGDNEQLVAVNPQELRDSSPEQEANIVNPDGKKEKWSMKSFFGGKK